MTLPSFDPRIPSPGEKVAGKYELVRIIGEGGMGVVYEAMHLRLQQRVAIKMLQPRVLLVADTVARFEREARAACRLKSRHAVRILDVDTLPGGSAYMVMEFLEGHDLSTELGARIRLPVPEAVDYVMQACIAMAEAHASGVVHRDLKPSNLFLVEEGGRRVIKVLDFGISKMTSEGESNVTSTFATMGTPLYMSPEQIRSTKNVDGRTDIWSLGVILYELLVGDRPFSGTTTATAAAIVADPPPPMSAKIDLPDALEQVVMQALAKKPEERFPDIRAFAEALVPFATDGELHIKAVRAEASPAAPSRVIDRAPRPQSTPSFVHATTMAQTPAPERNVVSPQARSLPVNATPVTPSPVPSSSAPPVAPAPTTAAAWSTRDAKSTRASQAKWGILVAVGVAVIGAGGWVKLRADAAKPAGSASAAPSEREPPAAASVSAASTIASAAASNAAVSNAANGGNANSANANAASANTANANSANTANANAASANTAAPNANRALSAAGPEPAAHPRRPPRAPAKPAPTAAPEPTAAPAPTNPLHL